MATINETITLRPNEGLQIEVSRIEWDTDGERPKGLKCWVENHFTALDIAAALGKDFASGSNSISFTEDEFEAYLSDWLTNTVGFSHKGFRWMWDKTRTAARRAA